MNHLRIKVKSSLKNVSIVEKYCNSLKSQFDIGSDKYCDILVSLTEAVCNAIIHGNNKDAKKVVSISTYRLQKGIEISVSDEGIGFNPLNIPDPTCPENIHNCNGRGVYLMKELCDDISFENNGSTVRLYFTI